MELINIIKRMKNVITKSNDIDLGRLEHINLLQNHFNKQHFTPLPDGWIIKSPDFVGVSSPKAGTSWWYSLIRNHPQVVSNRLNKKELSFFYHMGANMISDYMADIYRQAFASPEGSICGEWSPSYLWYPFCIENLFKTAPDTKIIVMLRNPIDRYRSHINQFYRGLHLNVSCSRETEDIIMKFWGFPDAIEQGVVYGGLKKLLSFTDRNNILMLQYEKCKADKNNQIARTYKFLGIDDTFLPENKNRQVNSIDETLAAYYADDVKKTAELFPEIDLALWHDFS